MGRISSITCISLSKSKRSANFPGPMRLKAKSCVHVAFKLLCALFGASHVFTPDAYKFSAESCQPHDADFKAVRPSKLENPYHCSIEYTTKEFEAGSMASFSIFVQSLWCRYVKTKWKLTCPGQTVHLISAMALLLLVCSKMLLANYQGSLGERGERLYVLEGWWRLRQKGTPGRVQPILQWRARLGQQLPVHQKRRASRFQQAALPWSVRQSPQAQWSFQDSTCQSIESSLFRQPQEYH